MVRGVKSTESLIIMSKGCLVDFFIFLFFSAKESIGMDGGGFCLSDTPASV